MEESWVCSTFKPVLSPYLLLPYNSKSSAPTFPWRAGQLSPC